ncbi:hypothetical protein PF002_g31749 [Phytophthora fragariae]|uniref:Uncharacterized protein n=1 Tax=Phytophthora fragariae TaxID=53985 RepID=A0A6A4ARS2_9STRA|nr:hypothetical protein PF003_g36779 [Phytophthora fragariae]KAE8917084.1 hypothetical protein PF009_g32595 [Phytophthora fragariae]KAE9108060.1 hypothetical protein PF007_g12807 [Phytophthora fragariae]KAE9163874.1 hypothetical protein PF002_g31749 [Phytophthora fragariae]KAE9261063.1 hypothetical protein PF001_g32535 [Phytophthora fragariae]
MPGQFGFLQRPGLSSSVFVLWVILVLRAIAASTLRWGPSPSVFGGRISLPTWNTSCVLSPLCQCRRWSSHPPTSRGSDAC